MNSPLLVLKKPESESALYTQNRKTADVVPIKPVQDRASVTAPAGSGGAKRSINKSDSKIIDFLIIGALSILVHSFVVEHFKNLDIAREEQNKPVKKSKVQISFVKPKPKPIIQPPPPPPPPVAKPLPKPVVQPPPPPPAPKVVAIKKPPKVIAKPVPKQVEPPPVHTPVPVVSSPVTTSAPITRATSAPPAVSVPAAPVSEKVTEPSSSAGYLNNPTTEYPEQATEQGWEGKVLLKVHVLANGKPDSVTVKKSSGHEVLDDEAVRTVEQWSFVPGMRGSTPIDGWVTVPITFSLNN